MEIGCGCLRARPGTVTAHSSTSCPLPAPPPAGSLDRIFSTPYGAEVTGAYWWAATSRPGHARRSILHPAGQPQPAAQSAVAAGWPVPTAALPGPCRYPNIGGSSYLMAVIQHPCEWGWGVGWDLRTLRPGLVADAQRPVRSQGQGSLPTDASSWLLHPMLLHPSGRLILHTAHPPPPCASPGRWRV